MLDNHKTISQVIKNLNELRNSTHKGVINSDGSGSIRDALTNDVIVSFSPKKGSLIKNYYNFINSI